MPFPELAHSPLPLTDAEADALVLALPPLDAAAGALDAWPGLESALTALAFTGAAGTQQQARYKVNGRFPPPGALDHQGTAPAGDQSLNSFILSVMKLRGVVAHQGP